MVGDRGVIEVYRLRETGFEKMSKQGGEEVGIVMEVYSM